MTPCKFGCSKKVHQFLQEHNKLILTFSLFIICVHTFTDVSDHQFNSIINVGQYLLTGHKARIDVCSQLVFADVDPTPLISTLAKT